MTTRLNGILIDSFGDDEPAGYPTLCKGCLLYTSRCV